MQPAAGAATDVAPAREDLWTFHEGEFTQYRNAHLGLLTHALHYGTACFEGIRAYWSPNANRLFVFRVAEHYQRLKSNSRMLHMEIPYSVEELTAITIELLRRNQFRTDVYVRPLCYKATEEIGIRFHNLRDAFMIVPVPFGSYMDTSAGIRCQVSTWRRVDDNAIPPRSKASGLYVNSALAKTEAFLNGFDEAIFLTQEGHVCEGSAMNIFILRNGMFLTPPSSENILEGITRDTLFTFIRDELRMPVVERPIDRSELYLADEVLLCGTGAEVTPVVEIDRRRIGSGEPGPATQRLQQLYFDACKGRDDRYAAWLTAVDI